MSKLSIKTFAEKYNIKEKTLYVVKISKPEFFGEDTAGKLIVKEDKFLKYKKFKKKITEKAQDNFYMLDKWIDEDTQAKLLARYMGSDKSTWKSFLGYNLFAVDSSSILGFNIPSMMWKYYRFTTALIRHINRLDWNNKPKRLKERW
jgi:hypothetical protein